MIRTYRELIKRKTFKARFDYLRLHGNVGESTFGRSRHLNQYLYHSAIWKSIRDQAIIRDDGCDLGIPGYEVVDQIVVHHINPITLTMIHNGDDMLYDLDNLITVSHNTHMAIHYGDESLLPKPLVVRYPGDTIPWKR